MRRYAVIDTEGTGVFDYARPANAEGQPRLASISILLVADDLRLEGEYHALIKPDGWVMSAEAFEVNKLSMERLNAEGVPVRQALEQFRIAVERDRRVIVAHNAQHDLKQIRAEFRRAGLPDLFMITRNICSMRKLNGIVPKKSGKKGWPKLEEACDHFGIERGDHTTENDTRAVFGLMPYLQAHGLLDGGEVHFKKADKRSQPVTSGTALKQALEDSVAKGSNSAEDW